MTKVLCRRVQPTVAQAHEVIGSSSPTLLNSRTLTEATVLRIGTHGPANLDRTLSARQRSLLEAVLPPVVDVDEVHSALVVD